MSIILKLEESDCNELERLHYEVNSLADLINRMMTQVIEPANVEKALNTYMNRYSELYKEYTKEKEFIESKYKPNDNVKSWNVDFRSKEIKFEE